MDHYLSRILVIKANRDAGCEVNTSLSGEPVLIETAFGAADGVAKAQLAPYDLFIVDYEVSAEEGLKLCLAIRRNPFLHEMPLVAILPDSDVEGRIAAYSAGADAVVTRPFHQEEVKAIVRNVLKTNRFRTLAEQRDQLQQMLLMVQNAYDATIEGWMRALDLRDQETEGHSLRVAEMTEMLARSMGTPTSQLTLIRRGALLHDIGKLAIPDSILKKPGSLTAEERALVNKHPMYAHEMLFQIEYLRPSLDIPVYHHEKWDGTGYPFGLAGEEIPAAARMFAIVDVWDALSFDRPYRKALPQDEVLAYLLEQSGQHFDPYVVTAFMGLMERVGRPELLGDRWDHVA